jgi:hypothetical protein
MTTAGPNALRSTVGEPGVIGALGVGADEAEVAQTPAEDQAGLFS